MIADDYTIMFMDTTTTNAACSRHAISTVTSNASSSDDPVMCSLTGILSYIFFGTRPHKAHIEHTIPPLNRQSDYCDAPAAPRGERSPLMVTKTIRPPDHDQHTQAGSDEAVSDCLVGEGSPNSVLSEAMPPPSAPLPKSYQRRVADGSRYAKKPTFNYHELSEERNAYLSPW